MQFSKDLDFGLMNTKPMYESWWRNTHDKDVTYILMSRQLEEESFEPSQFD